MVIEHQENILDFMDAQIAQAINGITSFELGRKAFHQFALDLENLPVYPNKEGMCLFNYKGIPVIADRNPIGFHDPEEIAVFAQMNPSTRKLK